MLVRLVSSIYSRLIPTAAGSGSTDSQIANEVQEVWIYGMSNQSGMIMIKMKLLSN